MNEQELKHYGVPGMKWGHRKAQPTSVLSTRRRFDSAKTAYKDAKKAYNKSFDNAYKYSTTPRFTKKGKAERDRRWDDAISKADKLNTAKNAYKQAKRERKTSINSVYRNIQKNASFGSKMLYNDATRKTAAKYVVDNNMSVADATKKANKVAVRNTGIILAAMGGVAVAQHFINK